MPSQGPLYPTTAVEDNSFGANTWSGTTETNVTADDGTYALGNGPGAPTVYIKATGFGFTIPPNSTILGISVEVEKREAAADQNSVDGSVRLYRNNALVGTDKADTVTEWPLVDTIFTYGSSTDLWGTSWTPGDINASDFGVAFSGQSTAGGSFILVDFIRVTVTYSTQAGDLGLIF